MCVHVCVCELNASCGSGICLHVLFINWNVVFAIIPCVKQWHQSNQHLWSNACFELRPCVILQLSGWSMGYKTSIHHFTCHSTCLGTYSIGLLYQRFGDELFLGFVRWVRCIAIVAVIYWRIVSVYVHWGNMYVGKIWLVEVCGELCCSFLLVFVSTQFSPNKWTHQIEQQADRLSRIL